MNSARETRIPSMEGSGYLVWGGGGSVIWKEGQQTKGRQM